MTGIERIAAERQRQVEEEGWTAEHDDLHESGEIVEAAICYALEVADPEGIAALHRRFWPWEAEWWKPSGDPIRNLEKAGALIAAEIDRLERLEARERAGRGRGR